MVETRNTMRGLDTGQLSSLNRLETSKKHQTKLEVLKSAKNQRSNDKKNETANDEDKVVIEDQPNEQRNDHHEKKDEIKTVRFQEDEMSVEEDKEQADKMSRKKGLSIEIVMEMGSNDETCSVTVATVAEQLLYKWTKKKVIEGVYGIKKQLIKENYEEVEEWAIAPKIVRNNKVVRVEILADVETDKSAFKLYQYEKEYCETHNIKIGARNTIMEYTKRIGFLTGPCVKIASPKQYIKELNNHLKIQEGIIDVRKKWTYENGSRSKVLVVNAIESKADEINESLCSMNSKRYRYISYKKSTTQERMRAMYHNDANNAKGKYEILENVNLDDEVINQENDEKMLLENVLMTVQKGGQFLFLAAEKGEGKFNNGVIVVLNPKTQKQARRWIVDEYLLMKFSEERVLKTSVDPLQFDNNTAYSQSLQEFLTPKIDEAELARSKYGKNLRSYAEVT